MKIAPLATTRRRDFALLTPGNRELGVATVAGHSVFRGKRSVENALDKLSTFACYVTAGLERLKHTTGATGWTMSTWHGRETKMTHVATGTTVTSLRGSLEDSADPFKDLATFMAWARDYGVYPSGLSAMSWNLFRASLNDVVSVGVDPVISRPAFFGGRQGIERTGSFFDQRLVDQVASYPTAMAARPVALSLHEVDPSTTLDPSVAGLAQATVVVPLDCPYPPLPVRVGPEAIQFQWGPLNGTWSWVELAKALELGCDVHVHRCWAPARESHLYFNWWSMAQTGRSLPAGAGRLAKTLANCLWGQHAMDGSQRAIVHWADDKGVDVYVEDLGERAMPHAWTRHLAAEATARVRRELIDAVYETGATPAHLDTDGMIISRHDRLPANLGDAFGQFRVKEDMVELEVKAPQFYRFKRPGDYDQPVARWHYVASGMSESQAAEVFRRKGHMTTRIAFLSSPDMVLPDGVSLDWDVNEALYAEALVLR